jgi:hypothetical protein
MSSPKILIFLAVLFFISCEKDENEEARLAISDHWHVWTFEPSADVSAEDARLAKESILQLVEIGCDPLELTFKTDGVVKFAEELSKLEPTITEDDDVEVSCASSTDEYLGTFDFDYSELILNFDSGSKKYSARLEDKYLIIEANDLTFMGKTISGTLYYIRETGH